MIAYISLTRLLSTLHWQLSAFAAGILGAGAITFAVDRWDRRAVARPTYIDPVPHIMRAVSIIMESQNTCLNLPVIFLRFCILTQSQYIIIICYTGLHIGLHRVTVT